MMKEQQQEHTDVEIDEEWVPSRVLPFPACIKADPELKHKIITNQLSVEEQQRVRRLVSREKRRFQENGYDLDLTYLTSRVIAMGCPAFQCETLYRNPAEEVTRFMEEHHQNHYFLYNLCGESLYDASLFQDRVNIDFRFFDHHPPPFNHFIPFCKSVDEWLSAHENNVVCIHCKAGKGRTGVMASVYLLWTGLFKDSHQAIEAFGKWRTFDGSGVTLPSQKRFIQYFDICLKKNAFPSEDRIISIDRIVIHYHNKHHQTMSLAISSGEDGSTKWESEQIVNSDHAISFDLKHVMLSGDVQFTVYKVNPDTKKKTAAYSWLNTNFIHEHRGTIKWNKFEIDGPHRDKKHAKFDKQLAIEICYHTTKDTVWKEIEGRPKSNKALLGNLLWEEEE